MRGVVAAALRSRATGKLAQDSHKGRIKNRDEEDQNRHREHGHERARAPPGNIHQRGAGKQESDEHRSAVAHENRRRIGVVNQKAEECRRQHRRH